MSILQGIDGTDPLCGFKLSLNPVKLFYSPPLVHTYSKDVCTLLETVLYYVADGN